MRIALVGAELEENLGLPYMASALEHQGHQARSAPLTSSAIRLRLYRKSRHLIPRSHRWRLRRVRPEVMEPAHFRSGQQPPPITESKIMEKQRMTQKTFRALSAAGISIAILGIVSLMSRALAQNASTHAVTSVSSDYVIPPADLPCILPGNKLNLQCIIANDPDAKRIRAEEAALEAQALAAAQSGTLDPYH